MFDLQLINSNVKPILKIRRLVEKKFNISNHIIKLYSIFEDFND